MNVRRRRAPAPRGRTRANSSIGVTMSNVYGKAAASASRLWHNRHHRRHLCPSVLIVLHDLPAADRANHVISSYPIITSTYVSWFIIRSITIAHLL
jgi:hypothetical protein